MDQLNMYRVEKSDLKILKQKSLGGRMQWIREKANEYNYPQFSVYRLAEKTSVAHSTISRIEVDTQPRVDLMEKIAVQLGVSIAVFTDSYYQNGGSPFTICDMNFNKKEDMTQKTFNLLDTQYVADLSLSLKTHEGITFIDIEETIVLSPLEHEEFVDEFAALISKVKKRRKNWKIKQAALEKLTNEGRDSLASK
ncbi:helix-turn-helix transcriptional regulator [Bacillaceae bacterium IKA-2]|nr:helix-turn-helix transcriptional regulator [Bacillaceae bacterium IKA-2]